MKKLRGVLTLITALALAIVIIGLQLAWNLRSTHYLQNVADQTNVAFKITKVLPNYAAGKLPNPEATKDVFARQVSASAVGDSLDSLYRSITDAYRGKTDTVAIDITPIIVPVSASGYQIPPGTVFANDTIQVGGLAGVLRQTQRSLIPAIFALTVLLVVVMVLGIRQGVLASLRNVALVTSLLLGGLVLATLALPVLIESLVTSSGLDAALRNIVLTYTSVLIADARRYYLFWILVLCLVALAMSVVSGLAHRARRPQKKTRKLVPPGKPEVKEL